MRPYAALVMVALIGCGDPIPVDSDDDGGVLSGEVALAPVTSGLSMASLDGVVTSLIAPGASLTFTLWAGDPDGIGDIAESYLATEDGTLSYGTFQRGEPGGRVAGVEVFAHHLTLSYEQLAAVRPFAASPDGQSLTVVVGVVRDHAGHWATESETLIAQTAACDGTVCDGSCVDIANDPNHCGGCGVPCNGPNKACIDGLCSTQGPSGWSACVSPSATSCDSYCDGINRNCAGSCGVLTGGTQHDKVAVQQFTDAGCQFSTGSSSLHNAQACSQPFGQFGSAESFKCCCI